MSLLVQDVTGSKNYIYPPPFSWNLINSVIQSSIRGLYIGKSLPPGGGGINIVFGPKYRPLGSIVGLILFLKYIYDLYTPTSFSLTQLLFADATAGFWCNDYLSILTKIKRGVFLVSAAHPAGITHIDPAQEMIYYYINRDVEF